MEESKVFEVSTTIPDASYIVGTDGFQKDLQQATQEYTDLDKVDYALMRQSRRSQCQCRT